MRAIATLERDARKASNAKPIKFETIDTKPSLPSTTSSALPPQITSELHESGPETITLDDDPSDDPSSLPPPQSIELDLTLSPTPPPPSTSDPLPFALPPSSESQSPSTSSSTVIPTLNPSSNLSAGADDLNALLSSLNMPPFDPNANSNLNFLAQGGVTGGQTTEEALAALLGTTMTGGGGSSASLGFGFPQTSIAGTTGGGTGTGTGTGIGGEDDNLTGFDFSSISGLSSSLPPSSSSYSVAASIEPQQNLGAGFDFSKFDASNGGHGLGGIDFSDLGGMGGTTGNGGFETGSMDMGGVGGNGQMSEQEMQELLKSLGG